MEAREKAHEGSKLEGDTTVQDHEVDAGELTLDEGASAYKSKAPVPYD